MRVRRRAALILAASLLLPAASAHVVDAGQQCEGTAECAAFDNDCYEFTKGCRHKPGADGKIRVRYWVNPEQPWLPAKQAVKAARAAASTWERANPRLKFIYMGRTESRPNSYVRDTQFVIGWGPIPTGAAETARTTSDPDITLNIKNRWFWAPCKWSCPQVRKAGFIPGIADDPSQGTELQSALTHELGHALGLSHPSRIEHGDLCALTMDPGQCFDPQQNGVMRYKSTLALGDILGIQAHYPFECPEPREGKRGRRAYPKRYRHVCPTVKLYTP